MDFQFQPKLLIYLLCIQSFVKNKSAAFNLREQANNYDRLQFFTYLTSYLSTNALNHQRIKYSLVDNVKLQLCSSPVIFCIHHRNLVHIFFVIIIIRSLNLCISYSLLLFGLSKFLHFKLACSNRQILFYIFLRIFNYSIGNALTV